MDKSPASPPFVKKRVHYNTRQSSKDLYHQIKSQVIDAIDASSTDDTRSLYYAYTQIGIALGIDKTCTTFILSHSKDLTTPEEYKSFPKAKLMFRKDPENMTGLVANISWKDKVIHAQQFLRRRKIPEFIIKTLHVPKPIDEDEELLDEINEGIQDVEKVIMRTNVACQTNFVEKPTMLDAFCQTAVAEDKMCLDVACQTIMEVPKIGKDEAVFLGIGMEGEKQQFDDHQVKDLYSESDIATDTPVQFTEWYRPKTVTIDDNRMPGGGPMRLGDESNSRRAAPYKINSKKKDSVHRRTFNTEIIRLVIRDLSPEIDAIDIEEWFRDFEMLECCRLKYDRNTGKSLGKATVAFSDRAAAMKPWNYFRAKNNLGLQVILPGDQSFD